MMDSKRSRYNMGARPSRSPYRLPRASAITSKGSRSSTGGGGKKISFDGLHPPRPSSSGASDAPRVSLISGFNRTPSKGIQKLDLDKKKIKKMKHTLTNFLIERCNFEECDKEDITAPSINFFKKIYTVIIRHMDQDFKLPDGGQGQRQQHHSQPKWEDEVLKHMKLYQYPYTINKSSLSTVGASHVWPNILSYLCYLINLVNFGYNEPESSLDDDTFEQTDVKKIELDALLAQYNKDMSCTDDAQLGLNEYDKKVLKDKIWSVMNTDGLDKAAIFAERERIKKEVEELESRPNESKAAEEKLAEIEKLIEGKMQRVSQLSEETKQAQLDTEAFTRKTDRLQSELESIKVEISEKEEKIKSQKYTANEVRQMRNERDRVKRYVNGQIEKIRTSEQQLSKLETEVAHLEEKIYANEAQYCATGVEVGLIPQSAKHAHGKDLNMVVHFADNKFPQLKCDLEEVQLATQQQVHSIQEQVRQWSQEKEQLDATHKSATNRLNELQSQESTLKQQYDEFKSNKEYELRTLADEISEVQKANDFDFKTIEEAEESSKDVATLKAT